MDQAARRAPEIQRAIAQVLLTRWDPAGVAHILEASDEYDGYVGPVYRLLVSGATDEAIAKHLVAAEANTLGFVDSDWQMLVPVAQELRRVHTRLSSGAPAT